VAQGTIKDYDIESRTGSLLQDDHSEVLIDPASTEGSGHIRYLRIGQRVVYDVAEEGGRKLARNLKIISFA
jgi:cold shock CspA family protein